MEYGPPPETFQKSSLTIVLVIKIFIHSNKLMKNMCDVYTYISVLLFLAKSHKMRYRGVYRGQTTYHSVGIGQGAVILLINMHTLFRPAALHMLM